MSIWSKFTGKDARDAMKRDDEKQSALVKWENEIRRREGNVASTEGAATLALADAKAQYEKNRVAAGELEKQKAAVAQKLDEANETHASARSVYADAEDIRSEALLLKNSLSAVKAEADEWLRKAREVWEHAASKATAHTGAAASAMHAAGARDVLDKMAPVQGEPRAWEAFRPCTMGHRSPVLLKDNSVRCAHCGQKVDKA